MPSIKYSTHDRVVSNTLTTQWLGLKTSIRECEDCSLYLNRHKPCLFRGHLPCDILYIGEAPGSTEDAIGTAMIGPTRDIIDTIIRKVDAHLIHNTREDGEPTLSSLPHHCIINTVQCHPVNDANPTPNQIKKCYHHVIRYLQLAEPTLIVLCGSIALQYLMSPLVTHRAYRDVTHYGVIHIPHPAFILRERNHIRRQHLMDNAADLITNFYEDSKVRRSNL